MAVLHVYPSECRKHSYATFYGDMSCVGHTVAGLANAELIGTCACITRIPSIPSRLVSSTLACLHMLAPRRLKTMGDWYERALQSRNSGGFYTRSARHRVVFL